MMVNSIIVIRFQEILFMNLLVKNLKKMFALNRFYKSMSFGVLNMCVCVCVIVKCSSIK